MSGAWHDAPFALMGVINVTPDSFSDGGLYLDADAAIRHGLRLQAEGADILDVGGASTRPGAEPVAPRVERERVVPVISGLREAGVAAQISIDTYSAEVAAAALDAGATLVNDITALRRDPDMGALVAARGADLCLMHMQGDPRTMQVDPRYDDVVGEVRAFLAEGVAAATTAGVDADRILIDPGIGFGKTLEHNLQLLAGLAELTTIGPPVLVGTSRKSFLGRMTGRGVDERLPGTIATNVLALERGVRVFRVHDVAPIRDALQVAAATVAASWRPPTPTSTTTR
jgi:dihydropteroate synthase